MRDTCDVRDVRRELGLTACRCDDSLSKKKQAILGSEAQRCLIRLTEAIFVHLGNVLAPRHILMGVMN